MTSGGEEEQPPVAFHRVDDLRAFAEQRAPTRLRRLDAEAEEAEEAFVEDDGGDGEREVDDDDAGEIRQQMAEDDARVALPERARGGDELLVLQREHLAADDARHGEPFDEAEGDDEDDDFRVADERGVAARRCSQVLKCGSKMKVTRMRMMSRGME